jgi:hypothetical protein
MPLTNDNLLALPRSVGVHALGDAVADFLVDVAPVFKRTL